MGRFWSGMNEVNGEDRSVESAGLLGDCENWRLIVINVRDDKEMILLNI